MWHRRDWYLYDFSPDHNTFDVSNIVNIKQASTALLTFSESLARKYIYVNIEQCLARPTVIDLNPNELQSYPFLTSLDRYNGSCNTPDDPSGKIYAPNKTETVNLKVFNMMTRINESKT